MRALLPPLPLLPLLLGLMALMETAEQAHDLPTSWERAGFGLGTDEWTEDGTDHRLGLGTLPTQFHVLGL